MSHKVSSATNTLAFGAAFHGWTALATCTLVQFVDMRGTGGVFEVALLLVIGMTCAVMGARHLMATPFGCRGFRNECATLAPRNMSCEDMRKLGACKKTFIGPVKIPPISIDSGVEAERRRRPKRGRLANVAYFVRGGAMSAVTRYSQWVLNRRLPYVYALATIGLIVFGMASGALLTQESGEDYAVLGNALRRGVLIVVALYVWRLDMVGRCAVIGAAVASNYWLGTIVEGGIWPVNDTFGLTTSVGATWLLLMVEDAVDTVIEGGML